ncbi:glycosyltransferase [uncultured Jatrophihabitans sp.]|uniref:glycosyltransferase n=1 Tax=uncultured Jatrophihabitans sp. TaxID=1610747 RepID=UPI0035C9584C
MTVALAHDYITQRGGAERVALELARAFPEAPLFTTLYNPESTFPEFSDVDVRASWLNSIKPLRNWHRMSMPALASVVSNTTIEAELTLASSSGWAHGYSCSGTKVVYCHAPARWLYQGSRYFGVDNASNPLSWRRVARSGSEVGLRRLRKWDARSALGAERYIANSTATRNAIWRAYGVDSEIVFPPTTLGPGTAEPVQKLDGGFVLCVARLLPYKNVDLVVSAVQSQPGIQLVVVGEGPYRRVLEEQIDGDQVRLLGRVSDEHLRWLYANCSILVAASHEDFGLSPLEAAAFGRPTVALRAGGYLDTIRDGVSGIFFDEVAPASLSRAITQALAMNWDEAQIKAHAESFSPVVFRSRIRQIVTDELSNHS